MLNYKIYIVRPMHIQYSFYKTNRINERRCTIINHHNAKKLLPNRAIRNSKAKTSIIIIIINGPFIELGKDMGACVPTPRFSYLPMLKSSL